VNKYILKKKLKTKGICHSLFCGDILMFKLICKQLAPFIGVMVNLMTNIWFFYLTFGRQIVSSEKFVTDLKNNTTFLWPELTCFILVVQSSFLLICSLASDPGYIAPKTLADTDNVITTLCSDIESRDTRSLIQLDELCLNCLCVKYVHVEHCK
jgi:hypothetical protein